MDPYIPGPEQAALLDVNDRAEAVRDVYQRREQELDAYLWARWNLTEQHKQERSNLICEQDERWSRGEAPWGNNDDTHSLFRHRGDDPRGWLAALEVRDQARLYRKYDLALKALEDGSGLTSTQNRQPRQDSLIEYMTYGGLKLVDYRMVILKFQNRFSSTSSH